MSVQNMEKDFQNPSAAFRAKPFWAWNDQLEESELRRQIRIFDRMGFGGFFMHSRVGLKTAYLSDEWFKLVRDCIDEADRRSMEAWLYDEDRWPSGPAGGLVTKDPRYQAKALAMNRHAYPERYNWPKDTTVYIYGVTFEDDKITWYKKLDQPADIMILPQGAEIVEFVLKNAPPISWFNNAPYLDTLSPDAVDKFIEITHEVYRERVGEFFGKQVPGIFTDEPHGVPIFRSLWSEGSVIPWTESLTERFQEWFGYDILQHIPEIMFQRVDQPFSQARYHYHCTKSRLFAENFCKRIGDWCEKNNLMLTGHLLEEEPISNAISVLGSAMQGYPYMQAPGIDILTENRLEYIAAKQCTSVARQTGRKWVLSELYGCTGWNTRFETYKHSGDWQSALGITLRCPHLSWYSMAGEAKRDYPASIHFHSPWWKQYKFVEDYFSRLNVVLSEGEAICDLAVIHPVESYYLLFEPDWLTNSQLKKMDQDYYDLTCWLLKSHLDFDFADEHLLVEFAANADRDQAGPFLQIGKMKYRAILVPPTITLRKTTLDLLRQFAEMGGKVVFSGSTAQLVDAEPSDEATALAEGKTVPFDETAIVEALEEKARRVNIRDQQGREIKDIFHQLRKIGDDWVIFMANTNRQTGYEKMSVRVQLELPRGGQIQLWDATDGSKYKLPGELSYRSADFQIDITPSGSKLVVISSQPLDIPQAPVFKPAGEPVNLESGGWTYLLDDYNVVILDRADCEMQVKGKKKFSKSKMEILQLDRHLRYYLEIEQRGGAMVQPWASKDQPLGPTGQATLTYRFNVKQMPTGPILLAIEQPERWQIKVNNQPINSDTVTGWWVDPAIKTLMIEPSVLTRGKNILTLEGQFDRMADLEQMFLLGNFGVETDGKNVSITKPASRLNLGDWTKQTLPFYSGNVIYRTMFDFEPKDGQSYLLKFPKFKATAVEVTLNGQTLDLIAWPEHQIDCTKFLQSGKNNLDIKVLGSRRNSFGPMHYAHDDVAWCGPWQFHHDPENPQDWQDEFKLVEYGLFEPPVIVPCTT